MTPAEFRNVRVAMGWSQPELARRLGYGSHSSINQIETGLVTPKPSHADWMDEVSKAIIARPKP